MADPFIIMCAPNGARRGKGDHPALPISPFDLSVCAAEILDAGASILHLHVRDKAGKHSLCADHYRSAITAIKKHVGDALVIQVTTEAVGQYTLHEQTTLVKGLRPEAVSIALREICPTDAEIQDTSDLFAWMKREAVFPQIILYDEDDVSRFESMRKDGVFSNDQPFVLAVIGKYGTEFQDPTISLKDFAVGFATSEVPWAACGFGLYETRLPADAAKLGGHVRVGFENNLQKENGELAENNATSVLNAYEAVTASGKKIATAADVRATFSLSR